MRVSVSSSGAEADGDSKISPVAVARLKAMLEFVDTPKRMVVLEGNEVGGKPDRVGCCYAVHHGLDVAGFNAGPQVVDHLVDTRLIGVSNDDVGRIS